MSSYCLKCKARTEDVNPKMVGRRIQSTCAVCGAKKSKFAATTGVGPKKVNKKRKRAEPDEKGEGIIDDGINFVKSLTQSGVRDWAPPQVRDFLSQHGKEPIQALLVARAPVVQAVTSVINFITKGNLAENQKKLGYDQIYHLYLLLQLPSGIYRLEKNQVVSVLPESAQDMDQLQREHPQVMHVQVKQGETPLNLILRGMKTDGIDKFWHYDAIRANCQEFVLSVLKNPSPELVKFVRQDAATLLSHNSTIENAARGITNLAAVFDRLIQGSGVNS